MPNFLIDHTDKAAEEKVWLVGVCMPMEEPSGAKELLAELRELVTNLQWEIVGDMFIQLKKPQVDYLIGVGKVDEIITQAQERGATMIVCDAELSPSQQRNWEKRSHLRVIDRQAVILDIFLRRAKTKEATLQVELACLEYTLPRLKRAWTHLSRQRGGGGVTQRGEGETQLELDQRIVRTRISKLKRELKEVVQHRRVQRSKREKIPIPVGAIIGYTNVGKSSLLNNLTQSNVLAEDKLFATLDPSTRRASLPSGQPVLLTDTVGFIRRLPHRLIEAFKATLEESLVSDFLIHVLDASSASLEAHFETTQAVLEELGALEKKTFLVINKIDLVKDSVMLLALRQRFPKAYFISVQTGEGIIAFREAIDQFLHDKGSLCYLKIPFVAYEILHRLHEVGAVIQEKNQEDGVLVIAQVPRRFLALVETYKINSKDFFLKFDLPLL